MLSIHDIRAARARIDPYVDRCPLVRSSALSDRFGCEIYLKTENFQRTGSFKIRGALSKVLTLSDEELGRGLVTASSGNHALGVAYAARLVGAAATIVMPEAARPEKVRAVEALGATVIRSGKSTFDRYEEVYRIIAERGCTLVHSCDDPYVIAGQGTIGLDIVDTLPEVGSVIVPLGAGALIAGIGCAVKYHDASIRVIGVEPEQVPRFTASRAAGGPTDVPHRETVAEGLSMTRTFPSIYELTETCVDTVTTASEAAIREATLLIAEEAHMIAEPSAAIGLAGLLSGRIELERGRKHVIVLTGGNISLESVRRVTQPK